MHVRGSPLKKMVCMTAHIIKFHMMVIKIRKYQDVRSLGIGLLGPLRNTQSLRIEIWYLQVRFRHFGLCACVWVCVGVGVNTVHNTLQLPAQIAAI